jgi:hypothetical protein
LQLLLQVSAVILRAAKDPEALDLPHHFDSFQLEPQPPLRFQPNPKKETAEARFPFARP